jgi:hypothetical protein
VCHEGRKEQVMLDPCRTRSPASARR